MLREKLIYTPSRLEQSSIDGLKKLGKAMGGLSKSNLIRIAVKMLLRNPPRLSK